MQDILSFNLSAGDIKKTTEDSKQKFQTDIANILKIKNEERNFDNTVLAYETACENYSDALSIPIFLGYVSEDKEVREASTNALMSAQETIIEAKLSKDIYNAVKAAADAKPALSELDQRLMDKIIFEFEHNGLGLPADKLEHVKGLMKELMRLQREYSKNSREAKDTVEVTIEELEGLDENYISGLKKTDGGKYIITMDYPDVFPFMDNAVNDDARKRVSTKFSNICADTNVKLLEDALKLREQIAHELGYKTHSDYVLSERMAKNPETVFGFLHKIENNLKEKGERELKERIEFKNQKTGAGDTQMFAWQTRYWNNQLQKEKYKVDHQKIKEYFPMEHVIKQMLELFGDLLGAKFNAADIPVWHKDVQPFTVTDTASGETIGYFYLDLFPREGKYKHAACFGLRTGRELSDKTYQKPACAIVSNFPKSTASAPSLLQHSDVETLFHEFGHVTHNLFTKSKYGRFSGTSVAYDFVEVPSTILESWTWYPEILKQVSAHYNNPSEQLPDDLINNLIANKNSGSGLFYLRQIALSLLDMRYHTESNVDSTKIYADCFKNTALVPIIEGTHPQANFGHLMGGYDSGYYSYLWSRTIALDLFEEFAQKGITNNKVGKRYRDIILASGSSIDENEQVRKFLGRDFNDKAFLKSIGL